MYVQKFPFHVIWNIEPNTLFIGGGKIEIFSRILKMPLAFYVRREEKWFILKKKLSCDSFFLLNSAKITAIHSIVIYFTLSGFSGNLSKLIIFFNENYLVLNCSKRVLNLVTNVKMHFSGCHCTWVPWPWPWEAIRR